MLIPHFKHYWMIKVTVELCKIAIKTGGIKATEIKN